MHNRGTQGKTSEDRLRALVERWSSDAVTDELSESSAEELIRSLDEGANEFCQDLGQRGHAQVVEARKLALRIAEAVYGEESTAASRPRYSLATELAQSGRAIEADALLAVNLVNAERDDGDDLKELAGALYSLAYHRTHHMWESGSGPSPLIQQLLELVGQDGGVRRHYELSVTSLKVSLAQRGGQGDEQVQAALASVDAMRRAVGPRHQDYAISVMRLGTLYITLGRYDDSEQALTRAREIVRGCETEGWVLRAFADLREAQGRPQEALRWLDEVQAVWKRKYDAPNEALKTQRLRLEEALEQARADEAQPEKMSHPKLGVGVVVGREGNKIRLQMEDGKERTFLADRLTPV